MNRLAERRGGPNREMRFPHGMWPARGREARSPEVSGNAPAAAERSLALEEELASLRRQRDALQRALSDAAQVQRKLSGPRYLRRGDFEIAGENFASQHVSGDLLTAFDAGKRTVFAIGDICGKGLFAGMWFTHLSGLIRIFAGSCPDPAQIATAIHDHFLSLQPEPPLATLFLGCLDSATGELTYGNPDIPILCCCAPAARWNASSREDRCWVRCREPLSATVAPCWLPETLVGYSDGVVECRNGQGEDFAEERLATAARSAGSSSASAILFSVLGATQDFAATQPRADDVALLVVHRQAGANAQAVS